MQRCGICQKFITPNDEAMSNVSILECNHFFHKDCLKRSAQDQYLENQTVSCGVCLTPIQNLYLNEYFGQSFIEDLNELLLRKQLKEEMNMIEWKCNNLIEVISGEVDYKQKDEEGKVISKRAAEHMANCRVRCNNCDRVFWSKCNVEPYHIGKTWEEFAEYRGADKCRFCLDKLKKIRKGVNPAFMAVCRKDECEEAMVKCCDRQLEWGHFCWGTRGEPVCLPCLDPDWVKLNKERTLEQTADDFCVIWYMGGLGQGPCIQLDCKHIFHEECLKRVLEGKWSGPRINFEYIKCPNCKISMTWSNPGVSKMIKEAHDLEKNINKLALKRAKFEGIHKDERLKSAPYNGELLPYARARLSYYMWFKCKKPYFGGLKSWENNQNQNAENFKPEELVWSK